MNCDNSSFNNDTMETPKDKEGKPSAASKQSTTEAPKLSAGAALKKQKQAEKAARRAQTVSGKAIAHQPPPASASTSTIPIRSNAASSPVVSESSSPRPARKVVPEDHSVAWFRHIPVTRRTTLADVSDEVHPDVLALGLQMSQYTICGSNARLVAMLQVFKTASHQKLFSIRI